MILDAEGLIFTLRPIEGGLIGFGNEYHCHCYVEGISLRFLESRIELSNS